MSYIEMKVRVYKIDDEQEAEELYENMLKGLNISSHETGVDYEIVDALVHKESIRVITASLDDPSLTFLDTTDILCPIEVHEPFEVFKKRLIAHA
jgi:hypothetical protein